MSIESKELHQKIEAKSEHELAVFAFNENITISLWEEMIGVETSLIEKIDVDIVILMHNCWTQWKMLLNKFEYFIDIGAGGMFNLSYLDSKAIMYKNCKDRTNILVGREYVRL